MSDSSTLERLRDAIKRLEAAPPVPRVVESTACADQVLDTSRCRSPSRALRRWRRGIQGRVVMSWSPWKHAYLLPDGSLVMHPTLAAQVKAKIGWCSDAWISQ